MTLHFARKAAAGPRSAGRDLYAAAVQQARRPALYAQMGAPDTIEGRFELLTLHIILLIEALRDRGEGPRASSQALFDVYVSNLDGALREMGVGDLTVGKRMRTLGGAFYGRAAAYREALAALPDASALESLIGRTVMQNNGDPTALAAYAARCWKCLAATETPQLLNGDPPWPRI
jgi:cytochrome b pre-mRNA-processing protein 3